MVVLYIRCPKSTRTIMDDVTLMGIAAQLRKPSGEYAQNTGEMMNVGNALINQYTLDMLSPADGDRILEIGMGNGHFVKDIFARSANVTYTGCDYSEPMVAEAMRRNKPLLDDFKAGFFCNSAIQMPFKDEAFNKVFTVNTLYFWDDHDKVMQEIKRVMKPGGKLVISIRPEHEMKEYPMSRWGFKMFSADNLATFIEKHGLAVEDVAEQQEPEQEMAGSMVPVSSLIASAIKA